MKNCALIFIIYPPNNPFAVFLIPPTTFQNMLKLWSLLLAFDPADLHLKNLILNHTYHYKRKKNYLVPLSF